MAGKRSGTAWKSAATAYKATDRCAKNKERNVAKHCARHPEDKAALAAEVKGHTRKASNKKGGWLTGKGFALMSSWLMVTKEVESTSVPKSRAVQARIARAMKFEAASRREQEYTQLKRNAARSGKKGKAQK